MKIKVSCGYRIHINSVDMNGFNDRTCGGIGFCVQEPNIAVTVEVSKTGRIDTGIQTILQPLVAEFCSRNNITANYTVTIDEPLKEHIGLGSITLLKLCVLKGLYELNGLNLELADAKTYNIGKISGIGVGGFFLGGLIADGGYEINKTAGKTLNGETGKSGAPILFRQDIPAEWKVVLALPKNAQSISGPEETDFFERITPIPNNQVHYIAYEILMGIFPALIELNYNAFTKAISGIITNGTKPFEEELNNPLCKGVLAAFREQFDIGSISSLGPAVYAFTQNTVQLEEFRKKFAGFDFYCTTVANSGFSVTKLS